jgi:hypothetical protein
VLAVAGVSAFALIRRGRPDAADIVTDEEQVLVLAPV